MENKNKKELKQTDEIKIEGVGTVRTFGELDVEKLVKKMLKTKSITD